jgi:glycosyltransferase involved in cell wall biosynthesis
MRIIHVMAGKGNGGAELYSTDVMLSLHKAGVDQCVVMRETAPRSPVLQAAGLRMAPEILRGPFRPWQALQLRRLITRERPDIIHCWMRRAASLVPASAGAHAAVIGWFGDYEELPHFAHCTHFVGVTKDLVRHMRENGVPPGRAAYIPTFPSVEDLPPLNRAELDTPAGAKVLLTLSRLHATKGLDTLIEALANLPDCYLWLAGDGPERQNLEALAARLGVAARVRFLGWRTDRGALLRAADICVLPSRYEPFGTVILDAWSMRTPLIACASDGPRAYIRDRENGMIVPADDEAALAGAILAVTGDDALRRHIAALGYAEYSAGFTREAVTRQWLDHYVGLMACRRTQAVLRAG